MTIETKLTYSNPRKSVTVLDWPSGSKRVTAMFSVETDKHGQERAVRVTTGKPKKLTYARRVLFMDGSDGRLYVVSWNGSFIHVMRGTFDYQHETIWPADERYQVLFDVLNK